MSLRIALVDDHAQFRTYLKALLEQHGLAVIFEAEDGQKAIDAMNACVPGELPDMLVMDVAMPGMGGPQAAQHIVADHPGARILALSMHDDPRVVAAMVAAGALGYMLKDDPLPELVEAIREVAAGRKHFSRSLAHKGAPDGD